MSNYDEYYAYDDAYFGKSYKGFTYFFKKLEPKGTVLDLGCGQGRDVLTLGRLGFKVMGIDNSNVGIKQMLEVSLKENLKVDGIVEDIYKCDLVDSYDIILLNSMFHFYKNDRKKEVEFLKKILVDMNQGSLICILILKSKVNENIIISTLNDYNFSKIEEDYVDYPEVNATYKMFVFKK